MTEAPEQERTYNTYPCLLSHTQPCAPYAMRIFRAMVEIFYVYNEIYKIESEKHRPHEGFGDILEFSDYIFEHMYFK